MHDSEWFGTVALLVAVAVVITGGFAIAAEGTPSGAAVSSAPASYLNLSIDINPTNGFPQYTPANFSVPRGEVFVQITDHDEPASWPGCSCNVSGTAGNVESINGSAPVSVVNWQAVAHTFTVPGLGINVLSPAGSVVTFTLWLNESGSFTWLCEDPCGSDGYTGAPMGTPGYMTGILTVV